MTQYIIRRILQAIPLLILINIFIFILLKAAGDPFAAQALDPGISQEDMEWRRRSAGLNDPLPIQFVHWYIGDDWYKRDLRSNDDPCETDSEVNCTTWGDFDGEPDTAGDRKGILRGDFGESLRTQQPVMQEVQQKLPNTLILSFSALTVTVILGVSIGMMAALRPYSLLDNVITSLTFLTFSMPIFLIALLAVWLFAVKFQEWGLPHLPTGGMYDRRTGDGTLELRYLILPTFSLAAIQIARYARFIRASMLETIKSDYIRTARAKGLHGRRVVLVHAFKNASFPLITLVALDIPAFLAGAVVTESIFSWPGMGSLFIQSLEVLDPPVLLVFTLFVAVSVVIFQLLADILYAAVDPRIRY